VLRGILHIEAARKVYILGQSLDPGMVQGKIFQAAWSLLFFCSLWNCSQGTMQSEEWSPRVLAKSHCCQHMRYWLYRACPSSRLCAVHARSNRAHLMDPGSNIFYCWIGEYQSK